MIKKTHDLNVEDFLPIITPLDVRERVPMDAASVDCVTHGRDVVRRILERKDPRKLLIVGPCSIHDPKAAMEYAVRLIRLANEVQDKIFIVMRAYFEKPRTHIGWKGYINDPHLDNTFDMNEGLLRGRKLLCDITSLGMPVGNEALDPILPQYLAELISWTAIGARTTESQSHREMASGLSSPVGFKNNTDGNVLVAINAMKSAQRPHHFLGMDDHGRTAIVSTKGNPHCHVILRGGSHGPNYDVTGVNAAESALLEHGMLANLVIDCSHDNSNKNYRRQPIVLQDCIEQIAKGNKSIIGFMLESNLCEGNQPLSPKLKYGVSITDGCLSFEDTERIVRDAAKRL
jgi:3-deoxy-7-phosphoheptulonate synthase